MWPVGKELFASPNFWQLLLLVGLGLPAVVAPSTEFSRRRVPACLAAAALTFAAM
jgi:hypothetical protein